MRVNKYNIAELLKTNFFILTISLIVLLYSDTTKKEDQSEKY